MVVSAYGYESITSNIEHSASGPTMQDIELFPLDRHNIYTSIKSYDGALIDSRLIFKGSFRSDTLFSMQNSIINLPIDSYEVIVSSPGYVPQLLNLDLVKEDTLSIFLLYENIIHQKTNVNFIDDSDSLIFSLDGLNSGDSLMIAMNLKFELELNYDYFRGYYVNLGDSVSFLELNGGDYHMQENFFPLILPDDHSSGHLCFILENDDEMNYRGVNINELKIINGSEDLMISQNSLDINFPDKISLHQNFPNPFNPNTIINFSIPIFSLVNISIYDINGKFIETIIDDSYSPGNYSINFIADDYASGVYFYRLECGSEIQVKQLIIIK
jgi:hypothetical protein